MTLQELSWSIGSASGALSIFLVAFAIWRQPSKDNSDKLHEQEQEIQGLERRVGRVETQLEHVPSKDDFTALQLSLSELRGTVSMTEEIVKTVRRTTQNIDDWLRAKGS
ncbi:Protein of unknown function [Cohaesibacter sp. ES.047]|uniref:DUF2730 family protein n=1 Tax=Cohaesibacter sp. ES.047 TaxID=1798205 RepID=UPI000BB764A4|nr:DUF2730 family protein [Cohaesibacter sp. ES.047]SNY91380.1 Protein of unknown function [Cohaesibacter sp. ES.047]